jgi:solute carrier family 25 oxoglutarate transporter 11
LLRIRKEEGLLSLWKGATPTVVRAMSLNLGMLVSYEMAKEEFERVMDKNRAKTIYVLSSLVSGAVASTMSLPFDNVKTKLQKMSRNPDGTMPYKGLLDCAIKTAGREGVFGFWAGLPTYVFRITPHVMITLVAAEMLRKFFK